jgi:hypothetical protein
MDIKLVQKTIKQGLTGMGSIRKRSSQINEAVPPPTVGNFKDTIILEPEDLIFTIKDSEIPDVRPSLVFEMVNDDKETVTQYMYMNQFSIPFLKYICWKFEVIIYSRIKKNILCQLLNQIQTMDADIKFAAIFGANACANIKLVCEQDYRHNIDLDFLRKSDKSKITNENSIFIGAKIKNIDKILKKKK